MRNLNASQHRTASDATLTRSCQHATAGEEAVDSCRLWVDDNGQILDCCEHAPAMFGYPREELPGRPVSRLLPDLAGTELLSADAVNPRLAFRCRCSIPFRAVARDGSESSCILFVYLVILPAGPAAAVIVRRRHVD